MATGAVRAFSKVSLRSQVSFVHAQCPWPPDPTLSKYSHFQTGSRNTSPGFTTVVQGFTFLGQCKMTKTRIFLVQHVQNMIFWKIKMKKRVLYVCSVSYSYMSTDSNRSLNEVQDIDFDSHFEHRQDRKWEYLSVAEAHVLIFLLVEIYI